MNSLSLVSNVNEILFLIKTFEDRNWLFVCKEYIFPEVMMNMKNEGFRYVSGKKIGDMFFMSFLKDKYKFKFVLGLKSFISLKPKYNELYILKTIPNKDILYCITRKTRIIAISKTNYMEASLLDGNIISHLIKNCSSKLGELEYYDIEKEKFYEMRDMRMLCGTYIYI